MSPRLFAPALALAGVAMLAGCTTKNYVRTQTQPLADKANQLDARSRDNNNAIHDVDTRATAGIGAAQANADRATGNANNAQTAATNAQNSANNTMQQVSSLRDVVANLDSYHEVAAVQVHFATGSAAINRRDKSDLDDFGTKLSSQQGYILEVTGGTDSTGGADLNYELSQKRANAVVQYLAVKYNVEPRRFYRIGMGKDKEIASNQTAQGRAENRRVQVRLLSNSGAPAPAPATTSGQ